MNIEEALQRMVVRHDQEITHLNRSNIALDKFVKRSKEFGGILESFVVVVPQSTTREIAIILLESVIDLSNAAIEVGESQEEIGKDLIKRKQAIQDLLDEWNEEKV